MTNRLILHHNMYYILEAISSPMSMLFSLCLCQLVVLWMVNPVSQVSVKLMDHIFRLVLYGFIANILQASVAMKSPCAIHTAVRMNSKKLFI